MSTTSQNYKDLRKLALKAGTDIENLSRSIRVGNPVVENIVASKQKLRASRLAARSKQFFGRSRSFGIGLAATTIITGLLFPGEAHAQTSGYSFPSQFAPWFDYLQNLDWFALAKIAWGISVSITTTILAFRSWQNRDPAQRARSLADVLDKYFSLFPGALPIVVDAALRVRIKSSNAQEPKNLGEDQSSPSMETAEENEDHDAPTATRDRIHLYAASRKGQVREENQDAVEIVQLQQDQALITLCDGAGGHPGGRAMARRTSQLVTDHVMRELDRSTDHAPLDCLETAIANTREQVEDDELEGLTTLILVYIAGNQAYYATLGDGALCALFPDGSLTQLLTPHHPWGKPDNVISAYVGGQCAIPPRIGAVRLEPGTIVMAMSDGVSNIIDCDQICEKRTSLARAIKSGKVLSDVADELLAKLEAARDPDNHALIHSDNMTLAIAMLDEADNA